MFNHLTNPVLLDSMLLDYSTFSKRYKKCSKEYIWKRFIRS